MILRHFNLNHVLGLISPIGALADFDKPKEDQNAKAACGAGSDKNAGAEAKAEPSEADKGKGSSSKEAFNPVGYEHSTLSH